MPEMPLPWFVSLSREGCRERIVAFECLWLLFPNLKQSRKRHAECHYQIGP
jgi:hypothetical protein